jgi:hypothetical protein
MVGASPKLQGKRYQAELHHAMQSGKVETDSPVHVLRTPSGRHINAGGTHRHIAREAMGKPTQYQVKNLSHEIHISPAAKLQGKLRVAGLKRGSKRAQAGKHVKPVGAKVRRVNETLAAAADVGDERLWAHPSALKNQAKIGRKAGLIGAAAIGGAGAITTALGLKQRKEWKQGQVRKSSVSAFGVDHGMRF